MCQLGVGTGRYLNHNLHQVLLCDHVFAVDDLFEDARKNCTFVHSQIDAFELAETDEVGSDKDTKLFAFHLPLLAFTRVTLVLQSNPELVHLDKVREHEAD